MSNKLHLISNYISYKLKAKDEHSIHSPFLFEFYINTVKHKHSFYAFNKIEKYKKSLLKNTKTIKIKDFGAGSSVNKNNTRKVSDIAKNSLTPTDQCEFLFKMVNYLKPDNIIELGTSLGIATSYLASASKKTPVYTIEACPETHKTAKNTFKTLDFKNIHAINDTFQNSLEKLTSKLTTVGMAFIDGHHAYQPTLDYFNLLKEKANENTVLIFDDIYWSEGMKKAWLEIQNHPDVTLSVDLFYFGIVFFRKNQPKQHFVLRF